MRISISSTLLRLIHFSNEKNLEHKDVKKFLWIIAILTFGIGDWLTTYYATSVLGLPEQTAFLRKTGLHLSLIGFFSLKVISFASLISLNKYTAIYTKREGEKIAFYITYLMPVFFAVYGTIVTCSNLIVIVKYLSYIGSL